MRQIRVQSKAQRDLKDIWLYTHANFGLEQADKYFDELEIGMDTIQKNPKVGRRCDGIREGYRHYKINQHYIFYTVAENTIRIIRVLHQSMNIQSYW